MQHRFKSNTFILKKGEFLGERWGSFSKKIISCKYGKEIEDRKQVFTLIKLIKEKNVSLYIINVEKKILSMLDESILYRYF